MRVVGDTCAHFWGPDGYYKSASSFLGHYLCHADAISHHHCRTSASIVSFSNLIVIIWAPDKVDIWIKSICDVLATMDERFFLLFPESIMKLLLRCRGGAMLRNRGHSIKPVISLSSCTLLNTVWIQVICWVVAFSRVTNWWRWWCPNDVIRFMPVSIQSLICFYQKAWIIWLITAIKTNNFTVNKSRSVTLIR